MGGLGWRGTGDDGDDAMSRDLPLKGYCLLCNTCKVWKLHRNWDKFHGAGLSHGYTCHFVSEHHWVWQELRLPCKTAEFNELQTRAAEAAGTHPREYSEYSHPDAWEGLHTELLKWKQKSGSWSKNYNSQAEFFIEAECTLCSWEKREHSFLYPPSHSHLRPGAVRGSFRAALH